MTDAALVTVLVVIAAVAFDFVNGFHDAANSIATLVATRALKPKQAVLWAAFFNFIAVFLFGTGVAKTVGSGMVSLEVVTPTVILAGLLGAVAWGLLTWWKGIPTSSSHALLGGYAGAAMCNSVLTRGMGAAGDAIIASGWGRTLLFIVLAPVLGLALAHTSMKLTMVAQRRLETRKSLPPWGVAWWGVGSAVLKLLRLRRGPPTQTLPPKGEGFKRAQSDKFFSGAQLFSSAFLSLMHGSNDAQKTAGIIAGALVAGGYFKEFTIPSWVLWLSYGTMALGTLAGGWRIVRTLGHDLTRLKPSGGFCAESSAALSILVATLLHLPVSTTHVTAGAVLGVGAARNPHAVRWSLAGHIVWAWVLTIPASALFGALAASVAHAFKV